MKRLLSHVATAAFLLATLPSEPALGVTPCGGLGQRACCGLERTEEDGGNCDVGLGEAIGCLGDCACEGGGFSTGTCMPIAPCGDVGQRACCHLEREFKPCNTGLEVVAGCGGNCLCSDGGSSMDSCVEPVGSRRAAP